MAQAAEVTSGASFGPHSATSTPGLGTARAGPKSGTRVREDKQSDPRALPATDPRSGPATGWAKEVGKTRGESVGGPPWAALSWSVPTFPTT